MLKHVYKERGPHLHLVCIVNINQNYGSHLFRYFVEILLIHSMMVYSGLCRMFWNTHLECDRLTYFQILDFSGRFLQVAVSISYFNLQWKHYFQMKNSPKKIILPDWAFVVMASILFNFVIPSMAFSTLWHYEMPLNWKSIFTTVHFEPSCPIKSHPVNIWIIHA